jgi:2-polyprenyl-3-methyl-5-hydroxy-6-metoxy-1,4-benzoquinol methylase
MNTTDQDPIKLVPVRCCVCDSDDATRIATGYDFEYLSCPDTFSISECRVCGNVYLDPRPDVSEFERIYPPNYHSLEFSEENYSIVHSVRSRLEARRILRYCRGLPADARILDVGCGDGFHLGLLRRYGPPDWTVEGIDLDSRAVALAAGRGLTIHEGTVESLAGVTAPYDLVYTIQTIEHVARPDEMLAAIAAILKPGGRVVIVTDNTGSLDFGLFKKRHWGGYHFPRHWNLFNRHSLSRLAAKAGLEVSEVKTIVSPVNWVYSFHNALVDRHAPRWLVDQFTLKSPLSLGVFTLVDVVLASLGRGALLNAYLTKPAAPAEPSGGTAAVEG